MTGTPLRPGVNAAGAGLQLHLLGCITVSQDGCRLALPGSRKARALLAYLGACAATDAASQLCELLWDGPDDPRGQLRWCLSKLRVVVGAARVGSGEGAVRLDLSDCYIDALEVERAAQAGINTLAPERARALVTLLRGDFLEGLELDRCPLSVGCSRSGGASAHGTPLSWSAWLKALPDDEALGYLEHWLELAPFEVRAHERLLRALALRGRIREGEEHLEATVRLFAAEGLNCAPLREAWHLARVRTPCTASVERKRIADAEPYEYYAQGRHHLARMMRRGLEAGREMFVRAIELDTNYGPAWSGLAIVHAGLCEWFGAGASGRAKAEQASRKALEIAPDLAEAHAARGLTRSLSRHYDEAEREFDDALRINPYLFDAYYYFARTSFARGDMASAARVVPPGVRAQSAGLSKRALARSSVARAWASGRCKRGRTNGHLSRRTGARDQSARRPRPVADGGSASQRRSNRARLEWSRRSLELYPDDASALVNGACLQANLGEKDQALDLLGRAFAEGCGKRDWVMNDPDYTLLRDDPRFQRLLAGIN